MIEVLETKIDKTFEKGPVRRSLFSNGAVSLFHQFKGMSSANASLYFLAGSIFETTDNQGIAHLIEHMLFKEDKTSNLIKELELAGASLNAYTYKDYVCFELDCSAKKMVSFLPRFLDLFLNPVFNEAALNKEKKVVIQEIKEDRDNHELYGLEKLFEKILPFGLGHNIAGTPKVLKSLTTEDLHQFYNKHFCSQKMILSVSSGKSLNSLEQIVSSCYKSSRKLKPWRFKIPAKTQSIESVNLKLKRELQSNIVLFAFKGARISDRDYFAYLIIDDILFEGMSSVYYQALREKQALVYGLGSDLHSFVDNGLYTMAFNCQKENITALKKVVFNKLETLANSITSETIVCVKKRLTERWDLGFDSIYERGEFIAHSEIYSDKDFSLKRQIESLESISLKDIVRIINLLIYDKNSQLIMGA